VSKTPLEGVDKSSLVRYNGGRFDRPTLLEECEMLRIRVSIMGAAGRGFDDFITFFRKPGKEVESGA
jgi:hypothetical protein